MQLTIDSKFAIYTPPKTQLLKWVGNKQKVAGEIARFFPPRFNRFYEPFVGSGAIIATVSPGNGIGSDTFKPLIDIWLKLKSDPSGLIDWYSERRELLEHSSKIDVYEKIKASFNAKHNGADFLFLSRTCYGGIVRFRKSDGFMSTPCGPHDPISTTSFAKRVKEWADRLRNVQFLLADFEDVFSEATSGDVIYCDPPYTHSQTILYGAQAFDLRRLFQAIEIAKRNGIKVALSIDGTKKSGNFLCDLPIPDGLFEQEIFISVGRSMLRRFQMEGQSLEEELVSDRLLLTYSL